MGFTFKREPRQTGLAGIGYPYQDVEIKHKRKKVGYISAPNWQTKDRKWRVRFAVVDPAGENCKWKWRQLKATFDSEEEAREWISYRANLILLQFTLHYFDA